MNGYVDINPRICNGKPVIAGTRIPLTVMIDQLIAVQSIDGLLHKYPELTKEQICGALHYCHNLIEHTEFEALVA